jgi:hypothetical protein
MAKLRIKVESPPKRCEICHQSDCFNELKNYCSRCEGLKKFYNKDQNFYTEANDSNDIELANQEPTGRTFTPRTISIAILCIYLSAAIAIIIYVIQSDFFGTFLLWIGPLLALLLFSKFAERYKNGNSSKESTGLTVAGVILGLAIGAFIGNIADPSMIVIWALIGAEVGGIIGLKWEHLKTIYLIIFPPQ